MKIEKMAEKLTKITKKLAKECETFSITEKLPKECLVLKLDKLEANFEGDEELIEEMEAKTTEEVDLFDYEHHLDTLYALKKYISSKDLHPKIEYMLKELG